MEYTHDMNLVSESGYCMPFTDKNEEVEVVKAYGQQDDKSFNHGLDLAANKYVLRAVGDGIVTAIGSNTQQGLYITTKYGKYELTYAGIYNAMIGFGKKVKAGSIVAISGNSLHIEVKYDNEEINPVDFLRMIYGNMKASETSSASGLPEFETLEMDIPTNYDDSQDKIEQLMIRFYPEYLKAVADGDYKVPDMTEQSLRNVFSLSALRNYFFEVIPSMTNPMGVGERSMPVAAKVQNLLIADFLNYLALRHQIFLSTLDELGKKKAMTKQ